MYGKYQKKNKVLDLEFHSTVLTPDHLGQYGTYKIYLKIKSKKKIVYPCILCTADNKLSKKKTTIALTKKEKKINFDIIFTQEDNADEKNKNT